MLAKKKQTKNSITSPLTRYKYHYWVLYGRNSTYLTTQASVRENLIKLLYSAEHSSLSDEIMKLKVVRYFYN